MLIPSHLVSSHSDNSQKLFSELKQRFTFSPLSQSRSIIAIGGDGFMLRCLHRYQNLDLPFYGIHTGTVGFLMNRLDILDELPQKIAETEEAILHPLIGTAELLTGKEACYRAINEISIHRNTPKASHLRINVDKKPRIDLLMGDGLIISTPAGSTAYNLSAHGPILPLGAPLIALTPNNPFRPRAWKGALLPQTAVIDIDVLSPEQRRVSVTADFFVSPPIRSIKLFQDLNQPLRLLFDPGHHLEERILREQFSG